MRGSTVVNNHHQRENMNVVVVDTGRRHSTQGCRARWERCAARGRNVAHCHPPLLMPVEAPVLQPRRRGDRQRDTLVRKIDALTDSIGRVARMPPDPVPPPEKERDPPSGIRALQVDAGPSTGTDCRAEMGAERPREPIVEGEVEEQSPSMRSERLACCFADGRKDRCRAQFVLTPGNLPPRNDPSR